jgi:hypothetical protein
VLEELIDVHANSCGLTRGLVRPHFTPKSGREKRLGPLTWAELPGKLSVAQGLGREYMDLRPYIRGTLWAGGLLLVALVVAGALWLVLGFAGDQSGSQGAKGVTLVAIVGLVLDVLTLTVLLALAELKRSSPGSDRQNAPAQPPYPADFHGSSDK